MGLRTIVSALPKPRKGLPSRTIISVGLNKPGTRVSLISKKALGVPFFGPLGVPLSGPLGVN